MEEIIDSAEIEQRQFTYAGFMVRFGAFLIDMIILALIRGVLTVALMNGLGIYNLWVSFLPLFIAWLYYAGLESSGTQATLGKRVLGIYVAKASGERISFINASGRYFAKILSCIILFIGFFMIIWDEKHQALHDRLAETYVIHKYGRG